MISFWEKFRTDEVFTNFHFVENRETLPLFPVSAKAARVVVAQGKNRQQRPDFLFEFRGFYFNSSSRLARKRRSGSCRARASAFS